MRNRNKYSIDLTCPQTANKQKWCSHFVWWTYFLNDHRPRQKRPRRRVSTLLFPPGNWIQFDVKMHSFEWSLLLSISEQCGCRVLERAGGVDESDIYSISLSIRLNERWSAVPAIGHCAVRIQHTHIRHTHLDNPTNNSLPLAVNVFSSFSQFVSHCQRERNWLTGEERLGEKSLPQVGHLSLV